MFVAVSIPSLQRAWALSRVVTVQASFKATMCIKLRGWDGVEK